MLLKKKMVIILLGIFAIAAALTPYITQAASIDEGPSDRGPGIMAQHLADDLDLSKDVVEKYMHQGVNPYDLMRSAVLAKASGKLLTDILSMKTLANTWEDVEQSLGVTKEQVCALQQGMMAKKMAKELSVAQTAIADLLQSGYNPQDISMSVMLAKNAQKSVEDVLAMKKINNNWIDVARELGVSESTYKQDMEKIHGGRPGPEMHGQFKPPGIGMGEGNGQIGGL